MVEVRLITRDEIPAFIRVHSGGFGRHPNDSYLRQANERFDTQRDIGAFAEGRLVASSVIHELRLTVPGGGVARAGGVTNVAVRPTHRRRGVLTALMRDHMDRLHADGTAFAMLWASESLIYERFGYGIGTWTERWRLQQPRTQLLSEPAGSGEVDLVGPEIARAAWPEVMDRALAGRPGFYGRTPSHWEAFHEDDPETRDGASAYFHAVYRVDGRIDGYVTYRVARHAAERIFANDVHVRELMAVTPDAHRALWAFILGLDLVNEIMVEQRPLDDPLPWMLADTRRLHRNVQDGVWLRLVDVPAALEQRTYATRDAMVIEVRDAFCPWNAGRYRLEVTPEGARCRPTADAPDLAIDAFALAGTYLGGSRLAQIAGARGVQERTPGTLARADAAFATSVAPWAPVFF